MFPYHHTVFISIFNSYINKNGDVDDLKIIS